MSTRIEIVIFDVKLPDKDSLPDEDCPICLESLKKDVSKCCGGYAKALKCGHFVHVSCQINQNPDLIKCPICRKDLAPFIIYYKICRALILNRLPYHFQSKIGKNDPLTNNEINELSSYGINYNAIINLLKYFDDIKENREQLEKIFRILWK